MKSLRLLAFIVVSLALLAGSASAAFITIDNFSNPNPATFYQVVPPGGGPNPVVLTNATGLGSTRTATIGVDLPNPAAANNLTGFLGFESSFFNRGVFDFDSNVFVSAHTIINYSNFTGTNGNFGIQGVPTFLYLNFLSIDAGSSTNIPVDVAISTTGGSLNGSFLLGQTAGVPLSYQIPLASLAGTADLTQVTGLTITLNNGPNQREAVDFVMTGVILEAIPAPLPPTALLALVGLPLLAALRKRR
jgi:hypothetical protein